MASRSYLRVTSHARPAPNREARALATLKYGVPVGWLFLFADADRISYTLPDDPERPLFFFRAATGDARDRLSRALQTLRTHPYFGPCFAALETLAEALARADKEHVELDVEEVLAMGDPGDDFEQQIKAAPGRLHEFLAAAAAKHVTRALELLNSLREVSGLELTGTPEGDAEAWRRELQFHKLDTPEELCRRRVAGELA